MQCIRCEACVYKTRRGDFIPKLKHHSHTADDTLTYVCILVYRQMMSPLLKHYFMMFADNILQVQLSWYAEVIQKHSFHTFPSCPTLHSPLSKQTPHGWYCCPTILKLMRVKVIHASHFQWRSKNNRSRLCSLSYLRGAGSLRFLRYISHKIPKRSFNDFCASKYDSICSSKWHLLLTTNNYKVQHTLLHNRPINCSCT